MSPWSWDTNTVVIRELGGILLPLCGPSEVRQSTLDSVCPKESDWNLESEVRFSFGTGSKCQVYFKSVLGLPKTRGHEESFEGNIFSQYNVFLLPSK